TSSTLVITCSLLTLMLQGHFLFNVSTRVYPFTYLSARRELLLLTSFGGVSQLRLAASTTLLVMVFSCPQQAAVGYAGTGWLGTCQNSGPLGWLALRRQCVSSRSGSGCR